jgi:hypothetical protein
MAKEPEQNEEPAETETDETAEEGPQPLGFTGHAVPDGFTGHGTPEKKD